MVKMGTNIKKTFLFGILAVILLATAVSAQSYACSMNGLYGLYGITSFVILILAICGIIIFIVWFAKQYWEKEPLRRK